MRKNKILSLLLFSWCMLAGNLRSANAQLLVQGPQNPAMVTEQFAGCLSCPGTTWADPMNASAADGLEAVTSLSAFPSCFQSNCYYSRGLMASDFGFTIPLSATITGIKAEVLRRTQGQQIRDSAVSLILGGLPAGTNKASGITWPAVAAYLAYGDSVSLWGLNPAPADINSVDFGFLVKPFNSGMGVATFVDAMVDHMQLTVYYTTASGIIQHQTSGKNFKTWYDPVQDAISIACFINSSKEARVSIFNTNGKCIRDMAVEEIGKPQGLQMISMAGCAKGLYLVCLSFSGQNHIKKVLVTE